MTQPHSASLISIVLRALTVFLSLFIFFRPCVSTTLQPSQELFDSLEELARIVDIAYCVGTTGIYKPFQCAGRCKEFVGFDLVQTWNTGPFLADSCGYIALSHPPWPKRIILAFRGTYSITNTIVDLSVVPQAYVPYPEHPDVPDGDSQVQCSNCTVHAGFLTSWVATRSEIIKALTEAITQYPDYELVVVGHSLGGAVAALAGLEFHLRGWKPQVTTFGEPMIGNRALARFLDRQFGLDPDTTAVSAGDNGSQQPSFRRVTHINDPVPLLPLPEWGYSPHSGEIYITKEDLPPSVDDLRLCHGDADPKCSFQGQPNPQDLELLAMRNALLKVQTAENEDEESTDYGYTYRTSFPTKFKLWELFFAHRDYFWRLGVCLPKPEDWIPGWEDHKRWKWEWPWPWRGRGR